MKLSNNLKQVTFAQRTKTTLSRLRKQRGLTLVEVGLAIAVSAIIVVAGLAIYRSTNSSAKSLSTEKDITGIYSAAVNAAGGATTVPTIGQLDAPNTNPWGGSYSVTSTNTTIAVSTGNIPSTSQKACKAIKSYFDAQVANNIVNTTGTCSTSGVTITFNR